MQLNKAQAGVTARVMNECLSFPLIVSLPSHVVAIELSSVELHYANLMPKTVEMFTFSQHNFSCMSVKTHTFTSQQCSNSQM